MDRSIDSSEMNILRQKNIELTEQLESARLDRDCINSELLTFKSLLNRQLYVADCAPGFYFQIDPDTLKYEFVNKAFSDTIGVKKEELVGTDIHNILDEDKLRITKQCIQRSLSGETVITEGSFLVNGEERIFQESYIPLYSETNQISSISVYGVDITDLKISEKQLLSTAKILELALKSARAGAWSMDISTKKTYWSEGMFDLLELSPEELKPSFETWKNSVHPDDREMVGDDMVRAIINKCSINNDYRLITKNGNIQWVNSCAFGVYDADGTMIQMIGICTDINNRKGNEEELKVKINELSLANRELEEYTYANQELKQFAYITSHQLQEPIRTVSNFTKIIEEDYSYTLDITALQHLRTIREATIRMTNLIDTLMEFSRLGRNKKLKKTNLNILVNKVIDDLQLMIKTTDTRVEISYLPEIYTYSVEIHQLFQNLIINGIKFQKKGNRPLIRINAEKLDDKWKFSVSDNGIGIDSAQYDQIFNIFQRLYFKEDEYDGYGIGLAYCKKIVHLHKGEIWVESIVGKGSTFFFTIPLLDQGANQN